MSTPAGQIVLIDYRDTVNSNEVNDRISHMSQRGIYSGGYLTKTNDTTVSLSVLTCEIGDANHQVKVTTTGANAITVSNVNVYVVLRWAYVGAANTAMTFTAVSTTSANDVVVGKCVYTGATLTGFDYTLRTNPVVLYKNLLVEPLETAAMYVRIRGGKISNGAGVIDIVDQISPVFTAPGSNSRIDVVVSDSSGVISIIQGVSSATPVAPDYAGKLGLAEVTLTSVSSTITSAMIRNVANATPAAVAYKSYVDNRTIKTVVFTQAYTLIVGSSPFQIRFPMNGTITGVYGYMGSAPTGANIILDVWVNGVSIWNSGANRLNIVAGATSGSQTTINNAAITAGQVITFSIAQVGSTLGGDNLTLNINVAV